MMKKQKWLLLAPATLALAAGCMVLTADKTTVASAAGKQFYTATEIGISGDATDYATLVSGATADDFTMEKGASVRKSTNDDGKLGIRFKTKVAKEGDGAYYTELTLGLDTPITVYVECSPEGDGEYYASLLYSNLTPEEKTAYKALEVTARGVYVTDAGYAYTKAEDNTRTMEGVANAAILAKTAEESDVDEYVASFAKEEKVYGEQATGLTVSYSGTPSAVYMNAKKLESNDLSAISLAAEEVGAEGWLSVVDANGNFTNYPYLCATKVIRQASDLASLYVTSGTATIEGYFALANDILYANDPFTPNPAMDTAERGSLFSGTFDGQGHILEYGLKANGLFGGIGSNAVIKDVSFIAKSVPSTLTQGAFSIIAKCFEASGENITLENIYATFDIDNFSPNVKYSFYAQAVGAGLFENANAAVVSLKNVMVDMSKVTIADPTSEAENYTLGFGAFSTRTQQNVAGWSYENTYVVLDNPYVGFKRSAPSGNNYIPTAEVEGICYAENTAPDGDDILVNPIPNTGKFKLVGVNQFTNYTEAKAYFANNAAALKAFESFTDTTLGFPVANAQTSATENTSVLVDGAAVTETAFDVATGESKTVTLSYLGTNVENIAVAHESGVEVVTIDGATITYTAGVAGQEVLKISATIDGIAIEKFLTVDVIVPDMGVIYVDTDGTLPASLQGVTVAKVVNPANAEEVYFDGTTWNVAANTSNAIVEYDALVYGAGDTLLGSAKLAAVAKVIEKAEDLTSLYNSSSSASAPVTGYFYVANDITDNPNFKPAPGSSCFAGILEGNGKKIEYTLNKYGLFGKMATGAVVRNVSLLAKGYTAPTSATDYGRLDLLAHEAAVAGAVVTLDNVYAKYDIENFNAPVDVNGWGQASGLGLFENSNIKLTMKNVIIDMSKVNVPDYTAEGDKTFGYGVFGTRNANYYKSNAWTIESVYVIWSNPYLAFKRNSDLTSITNIIVAAHDTKTTIATTNDQMENVYRYNDYAAAVAAGVTSVGDFVITNDGVSKKAN